MEGLPLMFTHVCEAWDLSEPILKTINGLTSRCLAKDPPFDLVLTIRKICLRYLGHILRMVQDRLVKRNLIVLTKGRTVFPEGSLFMDVANKSSHNLYDWPNKKDVG